MIVEYVRYKIDPRRTAAFDDAYERAGVLLDTSPHCITRGEHVQRDACDDVREPAAEVLDLACVRAAERQPGFFVIERRNRR